MHLIFSNKNLYLISYDICDDRSRQKVMNILKGHGFHVQKSVFECILGEQQMNRLVKLLEKKIDPETDSIRVYRLCGGCAGRVHIIGRGKVSELPLVEVV